MRRRKNKKVYIHVPIHQRESTTEVPSSEAAPTPELRNFGMRRHACSRVAGFGSVNRSGAGKKRGAKAKVLRKLLQWATGLCAVLGLAISVAAYISLRMVNGSETISDKALRAVQIGIWVCSVLQVLLIVLYSAKLQKYLETLRITLRLSRFPVPSLHKSPRLVCYCLLECIAHLLLAPPLIKLQGKVEMRNTYSVLSLEDFLFPLILLRNYHSLRFLFWHSRFSEPRAYLYAVLVDTKFTGAFALKCILKAFKLKIVLWLHGSLIVISGLSLYALEKGTPNIQHIDASTSIWTAANTVSTIGYGEASPDTYFGEFVIIACCFLGCFVNSLIFSVSSSQMALSGAESEMYSELAVGRYKGKWKNEALVLLQAWWRFMLMRRRGKLSGLIIVHFYTLLRHYQAVLAASRREKDCRFEAQIDSFQLSLHRQFHSLSEYLSPIESTRDLLIDIARSQYRFKEAAVKIRKIACKFSLNSLGNATPASARSESSQHVFFLEPPQLLPQKRKSEQGLARARANSKAHQRLKGRLVREKDAEGLMSPREVHSASDFSVSGAPDI